VHTRIVARIPEDGFILFSKFLAFREPQLTRSEDHTTQCGASQESQPEALLALTQTCYRLNLREDEHAISDVCRMKQLGFFANPVSLVFGGGTCLDWNSGTSGIVL
jgi:hypothetical protein